MTTDRELLEAAAKAAGMVGWRYASPNIGMVKMVDPSRPETIGSYGPDWNPLTDDGDALRLAVELGIGIAIPNKKFPGVRRVFLSDISGFTVTDKDPCAATRRAIVRAAAEMGK